MKRREFVSLLGAGVAAGSAHVLAQTRGRPLAPGEVRRQEELRAQEERSGPLNVDPQEVVRELEDFLRKRGREQRGSGDQEPPAEGPSEPTDPGGTSGPSTPGGEP